MKNISLLGLVATDEQTREWMAAARTPEVRRRIRRWSKIESISMVAMLAGIALLCLAPFASIAVAVWSSVGDVDRSWLHWWVWGVTAAIVFGGTIASLLSTTRRQQACFADGRLTTGTVDRAIEHPGSGDDATWWDLRISAVLSDGAVLRRRLHVEGERLGRRKGGPIRFRHNTHDPEELDDILFDGWPDDAG
ncbi:hypothetical protein [Brachybacterium hainanense]|uniref:Uncharacterized protein n=1 Tax=Brachybacterium hainanense TaxID=1541174 RepID=A0ABV6R7T0_9MICO